MLKNRFLLLGLIEILGWLITLIIIVLMLRPIEKEIYQFPFKESNIIFLVVFFTLIRYIFLLKFTFFARWQWIKTFLVFGCIPLFLFLVKRLTEFQRYVDDIGIYHTMIHLPSSRQDMMANYINTEMVFFGTAAIIATIGFFFRLIISIWLFHNRKIV